MVSPLPANVNLVQLLAAAPATALTGGEPFETVQSGTSVAATANQILSFAQANTTVAGLSVAGVAGTAAGPIASITGTTDQVLRIASNGTALGFGAINLATSAAVTGSLPLANITSIVGLSVLGVTGTATATMAALTGTADQILRVSHGGTALAFGALNLATSAAVTGVLAAVNGGLGTTIGGTNTVLAANAGAPFFTTTPIIGTNVSYGGGSQPASGGNRALSVGVGSSLGIAVGAGFILFRDETVGGAAFVIYDSGSASIVSQTGSNYTTVDPGAASSKWFVKSTGDIQNRYATTHLITYCMFGTLPTFV